jgi:2-methylcitrate dehydratase PrpD
MAAMTQTAGSRVEGAAVSEAILDWAATTRFEDLPEPVVERVKKSILDVFAVGIYGTTFPEVQPVVRYVQKRQALREASLFRGHGVASAFDAALLNGTFVHTTEFAEGFTRARVHPGNSVVPGLLAACERDRRSGRDMLLGTALGYELNIRMGMSIDVIFSLVGMGQGIHPPAMLGSIASALACAKALGFDREGVRNTLGIAANEMPSALNSSALQNASVKDTYQGFNSALGVFAADLAREGVTGLHDWVTYWYLAIPRVYELEPLVDRLGEYWHVSSGGIRIKTRPVMGMAQPATWAMYDLLRERRIEPDDVEDILVESSNRIFLGAAYEVENLTAARASIPWLVAAAIIHQDEFSQDYYCIKFLREELVQDRRIHDLAQKVRLAMDEQFNENLENVAPGDPTHYIKFEARVTIKLKSGETLVAYKDVFAEGTGNMSRERVADKFRNCADGLMPADRAESIIDLVWRLDEVDDAGEVARLLALPG